MTAEGTDYVRFDGEWVLIRGEDRALAVETVPASVARDTSATLEGSLTELGEDLPSPELFFRWEEGDVSNPSANETGRETATATRSFDATVDGLDPETTYSYRAVAAADEGSLIAEGGVQTFTTETATDMEVIDDFEHGGLEPYFGNTNTYEVTADGAVFEGDYSLKIDDNGVSDRIVSTEGLLNYPSPGDTFAWNYYPEVQNSGNRGGMMFGAADMENQYTARVVIDTRDDVDNELQINKREDNSWSVLASEAAPELAAEQSYELEVDWAEDDTITFTVREVDGAEVGTVSATDGTFSDETGVGWYQGASDAPTAFGNARIL